MRRTPPDVLITTPESLYLMLTSQAREMLRDVEAVIVDEIHAVAPTKRGAHLALTLERLAAGGRRSDGRDPQRIGLSATQNPLEEVGRFMVGPRRTCTIVDTGVRKPLDLQDPGAGRVDGRARPDPDRATRRPAGPRRRGRGDAPVDLAGDLPAAARARPRSTARRSSSSTTAAGPSGSRCGSTSSRQGARGGGRRDGPRGRHGDRARPPRLAGARGAPRRRGAAQGRRAALPGRDLVAGARHRHGRRRPRAPGRVAEVGRPRPAAHRPRRPLGGRHVQGPHLPQVPRRPARVRGRRAAHARGPHRADRRAAQPARRPRPADRRDRRLGRGRRRAGPCPSTTCTRWSPAPTPTPSCRASCWRTCSTCSTGATRRRSSASCARASSGTASPARSARARARASSRSPTRARSPTAACSPSTLPDGRRVGELDEEMVYEARAGPDVPARRLARGASRRSGATAWSSRPRRACPARCRSGRATPSGARRSSARRSARSPAGPSTSDRELLERDYDLDELAARNLLDYLREQQEATRVIPSDRTIVVERFRDEIGDWRLCVLSPYGGRVHAAWALALSARIRDELGLESDAIWSDDGIIVHLPDADEPPGADLVLLEPDELEDRVVAELGALGAVRRALPRERRARAADPARLPRQAHAAVAAAAQVADAAGGRQAVQRLPDHPGDLPRVPARRPRRPRPAGPARGAARARAVARRGRDADRVAVRLVVAVRLRRDLHVRGRHAQRRAPRGRPVARPRPAARAARPGGAARPHRRRRARSRSRTTSSTARERTRAGDRDELADVLRRVGDLTRARGPHARPGRAGRRRDARGAGRRAPRGAAARRRRAALDRRRRRRALPRRARRGAARRAAGGVPGRRAGRASQRVLRATRARTARSRPPSCVPATASTRPRRCRRSRRPATWSAASCADPAARTEREWCDPDVLRRLRRASLAALRKEIEATDQRALAAFLPSWQGVDRHRPPGRASTACARCSCRSRAWRCPPTSGSATCCRAAAAPTRRRGWTSCARRARSCGSAPARWGAARAASRCTSARTPRRSDRRRRVGGRRSSAPDGPRTTLIRERLGRSAVLLHRPARRADAGARGSSRRRSGTSCGRARSPTTRARRCARRA